MRPILKNWRNFLKESNVDFPYQIYCDMDGVLVDFESAVVIQINKDLKDESLNGRLLIKLRKKLANLNRDSITKGDLDKIDKSKRLKDARAYMYARFRNDSDFWASLPWYPGGKELWNHISKFDPYILTAPMSGDGSKTGKQIWIENNLNPQPKKIFMSHEKYKWATTGGKPNLLIDDFETNTIPWTEAGGIPILHTDINDPLKKFESLLKGDA